MHVGGMQLVEERHMYIKGHKVTKVERLAGMCFPNYTAMHREDINVQFGKIWCEDEMVLSEMGPSKSSFSE